MNYQTLESWFRCPLGQAVFAAESDQYGPVLSQFRGLHLLQFGLAEQATWLQKSPIFHQVILEPHAIRSKKFSTLQCGYDDLPIRKESVDVVVLPHTLESVKNIEPIASEVMRVLTPDGHILISGFNPLSLWGMQHLFKKRNHSAPWSGHFHHPFKLVQEFKSFDVEVLSLKYFFFRPPCETTTRLQQFDWLENIGQHVFSKFGGIYLLAMQKRTIPFTPIKPRWEWKDIITSENLEPTTGRIPRVQNRS